MTNPIVRDVQASDIPTLTQIYNHYIAETIITFDTQAFSHDDMAARIAEVQGQGYPFLVLQREQEVVGYAYAIRWKARHAYRFAVEATIYLAPEQIGQGLGRTLYAVLFVRLQSLKVHTILSCLTLPNPASVALHETLGMQQVAHFKEVGYKLGQWLDVGYWQIVLANNPIAASDSFF